MGYYTQVEGELVFSPMLTDDQLEVLKEYADEIYEADLDHYGLRISHEAKYYGIEDAVRELVAAATRLSVFVGGELVGFGEDQPDIWRIVVRDGTVTRESAKIVWPDGSKYRR